MVTAASDLERIWATLRMQQEQLVEIAKALEKIVVLLENGDPGFRAEAVEAMTDVIVHLDPHPPAKPAPDVALEVAETWMRKWNGNWTPTF